MERNPGIDNPRNSDLKDPPRDNERLRKEESSIDLPEVKDIPGQEHIHVPPLGELADTTISSADEEGSGLLDDLSNEEDPSGVKMGTQADLTATDHAILESAERPMTADEDQLQRASLDNTDFEGDALNERSFGQDRSGTDLDVPGAEADDASEDIGTEDEENNLYTLGGEG